MPNRRPRSCPPSAADQKRRQRRRDQQRRHRQRERAGRRVYLIEMDGAVLDMLVRSLWLDASTAGNDLEVGRAVSRLLSDMAQDEATAKNFP